MHIRVPSVSTLIFLRYAYARVSELDPSNHVISQYLQILKNAQATGGQLPAAPGPQDVHPTVYASAVVPPSGLTHPCVYTTVSQHRNTTAFLGCLENVGGRLRSLSFIVNSHQARVPWFTLRPRPHLSCLPLQLGWVQHQIPLCPCLPCSASSQAHQTTCTRRVYQFL